jgi:hypothetical protein
VTIYLDRTAAAELLFASGQDATSTRDAARAIVRQYRLHPDIAESVAQMAQEFGDHPDAAAARMARCQQLAPARIELPDALDPDMVELLGCEDEDCTRADVELVGKRLLCPVHRADRLRDALLAESAGYGPGEHDDDRN